MELDKGRNKRAILYTLLYHSLFDFPLTSEEIWRFLPREGIRKKDLVVMLKEMVERKIIFKKGNFYFLKGKEKSVVIREKRKKYSQKKMSIAGEVIKIIKVIPWIKMVGVSGALSMDNADENDDIDFLIITKKNRLWLTRLVLILLLDVLGKRRKPKDKKIKDKICLNMFLDESHLVLPKEKQNLFTAHEVCQLRPVLNKDKIYERFLQENNWVKKYLPNGIKENKREIWQVKREKKLWDIVFDVLEKVAFWVQLKYMEAKKTGEYVSGGFAFFHPRDRGREILGEYNKEKIRLRFY